MKLLFVLLLKIRYTNVGKTGVIQPEKPGDDWIKEIKR